MNLYLSGPPSNVINAILTITGSKSESNRLLLLQAQYPNIRIENLSNADDVVVMKEGLQVKKGIVDIHHAGTAMRFLTAYFATNLEKDVVLTGSQRMQERPIQVLVNALRNLGAHIEYQNKDRYPPLKIIGTEIVEKHVEIPANISSQYISALVLIAPKLINGLKIKLIGECTSVPYIKMTLALLEQLGIRCLFQEDYIQVWPKEVITNQTLVVESDWSSASYYYSIVALSEVGSTITLNSYKQNSLQGDRVLSEIYRHFGVETQFKKNCITLYKRNESQLKSLNFDLTNTPDLAQTIAVTCFGLGKSCHLAGLHTLKIKETDRLIALYTELTKLGASISVTENSLMLGPCEHIHTDCKIATYQDHRMAMAFAPLALKTPIIIEEAEVVSKSYPDFWDDLRSLQFSVEVI